MISLIYNSRCLSGHFYI